MNNVNLFKSKKSKKELLLGLLDDTINFTGQNGCIFAYEPIRIVNDKYLVGYLRKKFLLKIENKSKNSKFIEKKVDNWPKTVMIIYFSDDAEKGQTIAIEQKTSLFKEHPLPTLKSFSEFLNSSLLKEGYALQIEPIQKPNTFWETISDVQKKSGKIVSIEFSLNVPNLFGINDSLDEDLKNAQESYHATKAIVKFTNDEEGLELPNNNPFLNQSINYAEKGGGSYTIGLKGKKISSKKKIKREEVEIELDIDNADDNDLSLILNKIFDA